MEIGKLIKQRRVERGLSLMDVAKHCDVSKATIARWENGEIKHMKRDKIERLAIILNVSPITLITGELPTNDDSISTGDFLRQLGALLERVNELDQSDKQQIMTYVRMTIEYKEMKKDASSMKETSK